MLGKFRPSPALVVASIALFVALGGSAFAVAIVPRAHLADNALKLQGKSPAQVAALAPKPPPPTVTSVSGLVTVRSAPFSLAASAQGDFAATCTAGEKAISGGYDNPTGTAFSVDSRPTPDGLGWKIYLMATSSGPASGTVYAICLK